MTNTCSVQYLFVHLLHLLTRYSLAVQWHLFCPERYAPVQWQSMYTCLSYSVAMYSPVLHNYKVCTFSLPRYILSCQEARCTFDGHYNITHLSSNNIRLFCYKDLHLCITCFQLKWYTLVLYRYCSSMFLTRSVWFIISGETWLYFIGFF